MSRDSPVESLLALYVEQRLAGQDPPTPAELCKDCAELLEPLQAGIARYEAVAEELSGSGIDMALVEAANRLGLTSAGSADSTDSADRTLTAPHPPSHGLAPGATLGRRYQIRSLLGRGGMGEVWLAFDLKLRVDVALKSLRPEFLVSSHRRELLRREVRLAREVVSPHVCRVFDLVVENGLELVSMEYVDGETLASVLKSRGPLELREAEEVASQFLAGLEAIHQAGLIHRDLKPENLMVTRSGRVVVMDLGLARPLAEGGGTVVGTPGYMAREQLEGGTVDQRTDIFAAGVVLAELIGSGEREELWHALREEPPKAPESPWGPVVTRAVAKDPEQRFASVPALVRAIQEVTKRQSEAEERRPYPGLAAFTETDAEYFYGREAEVEAVWRKLQQAHLLALVGASGAGKSSFVRAGLMPARAEGWRVVLCRPGDAPYVTLAQALVPELSGDTEAVRDLLRLADPEVAVRVLARWRERHREVLMILDQFEELFTLNPREVQDSFAELLGRLALEADVRVLLVMRDDFLLHCYEHEALRPIFSELTPLLAPSGGALRRALVQPAHSCGYHFEDDEMVEEMLADVREERGALPLLAFAVARLWELRYREGGLLTRAAYEEMGGVTGALAGHAEETLERIGSERQDVVRELFRNLVTAEGTRAARETEELLSVFEKREEAREVLGALIDARLLTSYEVGDLEGEESRHRVEIVHESLLVAWPRLVRWRTQDEDSAQLRDQLRQAAKLWEEKDRSEDLLWSGSAYFDYRAWRKRYAGGLSSTEEAFAQAMVSKATRQRRRRRMAVAAAFALLAVVLGVFWVLWRQSERAGEATEVARQEAVSEARRAEAAKLLALARLEVDQDPSAGLAYVIESLALADSAEARQFAVETLWRGPTRIVVSRSPTMHAELSPDGRRLLRTSWQYERKITIEVWPRDGGDPIGVATGFATRAAFLPDSERIAVTGERDSDDPVPVRILSASDGELLEELDVGGPTQFAVLADGRLMIFEGEPPRGHRMGWQVGVWSPGSSEIESLGRVEATFPTTFPVPPTADAEGTLLAAQHGDEVRVYSVGGGVAPEPMRVVRHDSLVGVSGVSPDGSRVASIDFAGTLRVEATRGGPPIVRRDLPPPRYDLAWSPDGRRISYADASRRFTIVDLSTPAAEPLHLLGEQIEADDARFDATGRWLVTAGFDSGTSLWPLARHYARVLRGHTDEVSSVAWGPKGRWLASGDWDGTVRLWSLQPDSGVTDRVLYTDPRDRVNSLQVLPGGTAVVGGFKTGVVRIMPLDGGEVRTLSGFRDNIWSVALSPDGRRVAGSGGLNDPQDAAIRVWDLDTGEARVLDPGQGHWIYHLELLDSDRLLSSDYVGLRLWSLSKGTHQLLAPGFCTSVATPSGWHVYAACFEGFESWSELAAPGIEAPLMRIDLATLQAEETGVTILGTEFIGLAPQLSRDGQSLITSDWNGPVRVRPLAGGPPHLLLGHSGLAGRPAVSPDGKWIATVGKDTTVRIWPMPSGTPLQALPYEELLARLRALTNLRVVEDESSSTGYGTEPGPFPGWETLPTW